MKSSVDTVLGRNNKAGRSDCGYMLGKVTGINYAVSERTRFSPLKGYEKSYIQQGFWRLKTWERAGREVTWQY